MGKAWFGMDFRSAKERAQDDALYERWAFPHGDAQRKAVAALLEACLARVHKDERLYSYLMLREAYWGSSTFGLPCERDAAAVHKKAAQLALPLHAQEAQAVLAILQVDADMDAGLDYSAAACAGV